MINSLSNFPSLPKLETLSINNNNLMDLQNLIENINNKFPNIKSLNTLRNPLNPGFNDTIEYKKFKAYLTQLPYLDMVDGMKINEEISNSNSGKRDLFGNLSSTNQQPKPKRDLFGNLSTTNVQSNQKRDLFDNNISSNNQINNNNIIKEKDESNSNKNSNSIKMKNNNFTEEQIDGTAYVKSLKKNSCIMYNEKIFKKSDNLTKFNRENHSEGNKHILNIML